MIYEFSPKQDLHGWGKPWAPGANVNLLPPVLLADASSIAFRGVTLTIVDEGFSIVGNPTGPGGRTALRTDPFTLAAGTYYFSFTWVRKVGSPEAYVELQTGDSIIRSNEGSFTIEDETTVYVGFNINDAVPAYNDIVRLQIEAGSEATDWTPYSNICMPEGYNIWDPSQDQMIPVYSGYVDANANKLYLHPVYEEYDEEELVGPWMSSLDEYTEEGTPTEGAFVVDFGGEVNEYDITDFMLQTLLDSLGVRRFFASGAMLLNSLMDQAQGRVRSEAELLNRSLPLHVIAIGEDLPTNLVIKKPVSDVLPGLPGKIKNLIGGNYYGT